MSIGQSQPTPLTPVTYPIYRGFYVLPGDTVSSLSPTPIQVNFWVSRSSDNITWEGWTLVGQASSSNGFYIGHTGLDENTYYAYYCQYQYSDTSLGPVGQTVYPGRAQLIANPTLNIDQLASKAYSTGLVTAGTFRGVIFETSATNPKVRMDPSGIFATNGAGQTVFSLSGSGGTAQFSGAVVLPETQNYGTTSTPVFGSAVQWTTDGTVFSNVKEYIQGFDLAAFPAGNGNIHYLALGSVATPVAGVTPRGSWLFLQAQDGARSGTGAITVQLQDAVNTTQTANILTSDGTSDFLQKGNNLSEVVAGTARTNIGAYGSGDSPTFGQVTLNGLVVNDTVVRTISVGSSHGTKIGGAAASLLAFYGQTPVTQPTNSASGGFVNGAGAAANIGWTSTGSVGTTAYNFNQIVMVLKNLGLIAS